MSWIKSYELRCPIHQTIEFASHEKAIAERNRCYIYCEPDEYDLACEILKNEKAEAVDTC